METKERQNGDERKTKERKNEDKGDKMEYPYLPKQGPAAIQPIPFR